jgi:hypothetical protein
MNDEAVLPYMKAQFLMTEKTHEKGCQDSWHISGDSTRSPPDVVSLHPLISSPIIVGWLGASGALLAPVAQQI